MATRTRRRKSRTDSKRAAEFEPIQFPTWVTTWWLQAVFFVLFLALAIAFAFLRPTDIWVMIGSGLAAWAALLSLHAAVRNRSRRPPGRIGSWMLFLFAIIGMTLLTAKYIIRSGGT
jgi:hypothetical protein